MEKANETELCRGFASPASLKVKPLVWVKDGKSYSALTKFGEYRVAKIHGEWMWLFAWLPKSNEEKIDQGYGDKNSPSSAKHAAQVDHDARVTGSIMETQATTAQCCMCGKRDLSTAEDGGPECELSDGRWVCSRYCYGIAIDGVTVQGAALRLLADDQAISQIAQAMSSEPGATQDILSSALRAIADGK